MIGSFPVRAGSSLPWLDVQITSDGQVDVTLLGRSDTACCAAADSGKGVDLTDATVTFLLFSAAGRLPVPVPTTGTVEVLTPATGLVRYKWGGQDLATPGLYYGLFSVSFAGGGVFRWPAQAEQLSIEVF